MLAVIVNLAVAACEALNYFPLRPKQLSRVHRIHISIVHNELRNGQRHFCHRVL